MRHTISILLLSLTLSGCAYVAEPPSIATYNVYSSYDGKLSGKYLLYVDGSNLNKPIKPSDLNCSAHTFPVSLSQSFATSIHKTFDNLVSELEVVDTPVTRSDLARRHARGLIIIRGENVTARMRVVPGFWTAMLESELEISASIVVDGRKGRLLGKTVSGEGHGQAETGMLCAGGSKSLRLSSEGAMKKTLERLGEALVNSERVRTGS